jgi:hypothetical protein
MAYEATQEGREVLLAATMPRWITGTVLPIDDRKCIAIPVSSIVVINIEKERLHIHVGPSSFYYTFILADNPTLIDQLHSHGLSLS